MRARALGVIPARYGSTRFPGKPLASIAGKPLIQHVYERALQAASLAQVIVATDDARIRDVIALCGGSAVMTPRDLPSGTDRVAAAARDLPCDVVVNIQGDEPLIDPRAIDDVARALLDDPQRQMATLRCPITDPAEIASPHVVKVVCDQAGKALHFSRAPISYQRAGQVAYAKHVGVYAYRKAVLLRLVALAPTVQEQTERLEQLRAVEHGIPIYVVETTYHSLAVDTPDDVDKIVALIERAQ